MNKFSLFSQVWEDIAPTMALETQEPDLLDPHHFLPFVCSTHFINEC